MLHVYYLSFISFSILHLVIMTITLLGGNVSVCKILETFPIVIHYKIFLSLLQHYKRIQTGYDVNNKKIIIYFHYQLLHYHDSPMFNFLLISLLFHNLRKSHSHNFLIPSYLVSITPCLLLYFLLPHIFLPDLI